MTLLSVLICTYNRPDLLEMALNALICNTDEKPDQIIVVNGGGLRSDQIVQKYIKESNIKIKLVKTVNKNLAASRNVGLEYCEGEIVAMTDDDAEVFSDWVTMMKKIHAEHPEAGAVGGSVFGAANDESLLSRIADVATFSSPAQACYVRTIAGVNISYKRSVLQLVGFQDESLFRGEDVDFNWRIKQQGFEIYYHPEIKVLHHHRPTFKKFVDQFYMYGRAYHVVRRKWPEMYCVYPQRILHLKDLLKLLYFIASTIFEPFLSAMKMPVWSDRFYSLPIFYVLHIAWKSGMLVQKYFNR